MTSHPLKISIFLFAIIGMLSSSTPSLAISETGFQVQYAKEVVPFFKKSPETFFIGADGIKIGYRAFKNPDASSAIVLVNGYSQDLNWYSELVYDLYKKGYSVYTFDHRGQGFSGRLISDIHQGHIDDFENLIADMHFFVSSIVKQNEKGPLFLLAHSMGAAVSAIYLAKYQNDFKAAVFSAPMLKINLAPWNETVASAVANFLCFFGLGSKVANASSDPATVLFEKNETTQSRDRYLARLERIKSDFPARFLGTTFGWVKEAVGGSRKARQSASQIATPLLVLEAEQETIVDPLAEEDFCRQAPHCSLEKMPTQHDIFSASDVVRDHALNSTLAFFRNDRTSEKRPNR